MWEDFKISHFDLQTGYITYAVARFKMKYLLFSCQESRLFIFFCQTMRGNGNLRTFGYFVNRFVNGHIARGQCSEYRYIKIVERMLHSKLYQTRWIVTDKQKCVNSNKIFRSIIIDLRDVRKYILCNCRCVKRFG